MADEQPSAASRKRSRGPEAASRSQALEFIRAVRSGGGRRSEAGGYQVKLENPIYDTIPEDEYDALVAKRREEARGFIVDDDGLGYGDEGEEEDWSIAGVNFSDESDGEVPKPKRRKPEKKEAQPKKPPSSSLSAAAAAMKGKQKLSSMFTSSIFRKTSRDDKAKGSASDSIVDDVIAEFAPDETDRERRRRGQIGAMPISRIFAPIPAVNFEGLTAPSLNLTGGSELIEDIGNGNFGVTRVDTNSDMEPVRAGIEVQENGESKEIEENEGLNSQISPDPIVQSDSSSIREDVIEDNMPIMAETKVEPLSNKGPVCTLNAMINEERNPALSATAGWQAVRSEGGGNVDPAAEISEETLKFDTDTDGSLPFYIIDAHEELFGANSGTVYLFGKVKAGDAYHSCCVVVKNIQRCIYAIPSASFLQSDEMLKLQNDAEQYQLSPADLRTKLQEVTAGLKNEIAKQLLDLNVSTFSMTPVKRKYAFERHDIPAGENYVIKINYPFKHPPLPADLKGESFCALLGTHCSALELLLIKRKIKGPSWLSISKFSSCSGSQQVSWCKFEVTVDSPKDVQISNSSSKTLEIPPMIVSAINIKTIINEKQNVNEIVSASVICCQRAKIDGPMLATEWKKPGMLRHFTIIRKLDGCIFPMGFTNKSTERNHKAGSNVLFCVSSEGALLNRLMNELYDLDSDVLVGHNISGFDLDVLLHRAQFCQIASRKWSKIGRLKRSVMPKLGKGGSIFGSGASPGVMACIAGRLLCDTYLSSRDLLKEISYSLTELAKTQLNKDRKEVTPHDIPSMFQASESLMDLIEYGETDAWLSLELMFHLSVLPLTRQLTNISGNLWGRSLQGARAQRVEYLLLHAFHAKKYIVPDKTSSYMKEKKIVKKRMIRGSEEKHVDELDLDDANVEFASNTESGKGKKASSYAGGLVLEPKRGLYDKYILLLDFNSLYPSIIQEYNICFTTVERPPDGVFPRLPTTKMTGVLPELLKNLVQRRRMVKSWMKNASGLKLQQLDIQQQALKLTANSMYGCLGFSNSRFYAKPLAELITSQGREILQSTVDLVQNNLNLEVIYGDTDSIMIHSGLDDIGKAKAIAGKVIQEVNKKYTCLEIDLDGLYKRMLLLKKKKYAAVKLQFKDGMPYEVIERKGLDMVRRDWSLLSKELGDFCLSQILSGGSCDDVIASIHDSLTKIQEDMRKGQVALEKYIITKTLTKPPEAYPDARNQPHVQVAQRLKQMGYSTGCSVGDTIPYIICCEQGSTSGGSTGIAQRARHPDELKREDGKWIIDIDYYLSQQIHPVVSRLCASIQGTSPERLAHCLGLDSSKFQAKSSEVSSSDVSSSLPFSVSAEERYQSCKPLVLTCPRCYGTFDVPTIFSSINKSIYGKQESPAVDEPSRNFWSDFKCPNCKDLLWVPEEANAMGRGRMTCGMISNQVKMQIDRFIAKYYHGLMTCDEETCKYTTRTVNLRRVGDSRRGILCPKYPQCDGHLTRTYTEADLWKQICYFYHVLDTERCMEKLEIHTRLTLEKEMAKIRPLVELTTSTIKRIRDRSSYGWVKLENIAVIV